MLRARFLAATAVALLIGFGCYEFWQWRRAAHRYEAWLDSKEEAVLPAVMIESFQWEGAQLTLSEFAALISEKSGLRVEIDEANIPPRGSVKGTKPGEIPLRVPRGNFELGTLI